MRSRTEKVTKAQKVIMTKENQVMERNKRQLPHLARNDDFLRTMQSVFSYSRCFGIPTIGGRFTMVWFILLLTLHVAMEAGTVWKLFKVIAGWAAFSSGNRSIVARLSGAVFYGNALLSLLLFWKLKSGWSQLTRDWIVAESCTSLYFPPDEKLRRRLMLVIGVVVFFASLEHIMSMAALIGTDPPPDILQHYILNSHAFLIIPSDYSLPLGIVMFIISKTSTLLWNFQDMVIILISFGLTSRYRRLNNYVQKITTKEILSDLTVSEADEEFKNLNTWRRVREAYVRQSALVRKVDQVLGNIILLSNSNNFYFICLQVFNGVGSETGGTIDKVYYYISIVWLFARAFSVILAAAEISAASKKPLKFIFEYPDRCYNIELQRLERQLSKDSVVLSAKGFFHLDRGLILQMVASVIKYELVLLEFDK